MLKNVQADVAVSVNWVNIIEKESIACFRYGILNAHAGDLPRYRGNACPNWAIILGETEVAVSVHFMEPNKLDSGDILAKRYMPISSQTRIGEIYAWLEESIPKMFVESISMLEEGKVIPEKQSHDCNTWLRVFPRIPSDSRIDWTKSSTFIERLVNASSEPFSGAYTYYGMKKMVIWRAHAGNWEYPSVAVHGQVVKRDAKNGTVAIACGDGIILLEEVSIAGNRQRPYDVIKSLRDRLGMCVEDELYKMHNLLVKWESNIRFKDGV